MVYFPSLSCELVKLPAGSQFDCRYVYFEDSSLLKKLFFRFFSSHKFCYKCFPIIVGVPLLIISITTKKHISVQTTNQATNTKQTTIGAIKIGIGKNRTKAEN